MMLQSEEGTVRKRKKSGPLSVHAISGTYVVLLGFNLPEADCDDLLGFSVHRTDETENEAYFIQGMKCFEATDPGFPAGSSYPTSEHPVQSFQWSDYTAKPGHRYIYKVTALKGTPVNLQPLASVSVPIETESPEGDVNDVYFNRGVAASQAYTNRFGDRSPDDVPNGKAFDWLSRGLFEAMLAFVKPAKPGDYAFRVAAYEFRHEPFLRALKEIAAAGADVEIIYDARKDDPGEANRDLVQQLRMGQLCRERTASSSFISHNKFIVRLHKGIPEAVWTGGTNFSRGGIFGHSNVAHVVENAGIAQLYLDYWNVLSGDPDNATLKPQIEALTPLPAGRPPKGVTAIFSPRKNLDALNWYAGLAQGARNGLFMTFAFGMNKLWRDVYQNCQAPLRFALLEKKTRSMPAGPARVKEEKAIDQLRQLNENVFAIGSLIRTNEFDGWVKERLSGLNRNVAYVHNKFMLVDPLGNDPIVIAGSANFSEASTKDNDENMLVTRGNKRVADIYLGEFMRLYSHHAFRESLKWRDPNEPPKFLKTDDWWRDYFKNNSRSARREFFR